MKKGADQKLQVRDGKGTTVDTASKPATPAGQETSINDLPPDKRTSMLAKAKENLAPIGRALGQTAVAAGTELAVSRLTDPTADLGKVAGAALLRNGIGAGIGAVAETAAGWKR